MEWGDQLAKHIKRALDERGLSNAQIASMLGISRHSTLRDDLATIRRGQACSIGQIGRAHV